MLCRLVLAVTLILRGYVEEVWGGMVVSGSEYRAMVMCRVFEHKHGGRDGGNQVQCIANQGQSCDKGDTWPLVLCHLWRSRPLSL